MLDRVWRAAWPVGARQPTANSGYARLTDIDAQKHELIVAVDALTGDRSARICLAVSGGADSMAMLLLAADAMPDRILAATVDHGLRAEAADEAAFVGRHCKALGVAHATLKPHAPITGNLQSQARAVRYDLLQSHARDAGCAFIATAHHGDDQIETFLMRLARGSGVSGLSAIRARNGNIIRPLLGQRRAALEAVCAQYGVTPVQDPSNSDDSFDRVRMRQWLRQNDLPVSAEAVQQSAAALSDTAEALDWIVEQLAASRLHRRSDGVEIDMGGLPGELKRRLLLYALGQAGEGSSPRGEALSRAVSALDGGKKTMLGDSLIIPGERWQITPAPKRRR